MLNSSSTDSEISQHESCTSLCFLWRLIVSNSNKCFNPPSYPMKSHLVGSTCLVMTLSQRFPACKHYYYQPLHIYFADSSCLDENKIRLECESIQITNVDKKGQNEGTRTYWDIQGHTYYIGPSLLIVVE